MHRIFKEALKHAKGESHHIIAVFIDIRDFSRFSQKCDSVDVATYLSKIYIKIIDSYFPFATFYKSTGDGLLLVIPWDEASLEENSQKVVESSIKCHSEFGKICAGDPSINFEVPSTIGIGIARGSACCLVSEDTVIDYSGKYLNLASRLTDIARPSGIVMDGDFVIELLTKAQQKYFKEDYVFLKGIAEIEPIKIYYNPKFTVIPKFNKHPISDKNWKEDTHVYKYRDIKSMGKWFAYSLPSKAESEEDIKISISHRAVIDGKVSRKIEEVRHIKDFRYGFLANEPRIWIDMENIAEVLDGEQVKDNMAVTIAIYYVEKIR